MKIRKNRKANLESKRSIFLQIGFIVGLAFVLMAFEWTTIETDKFDWDFDRGTIIDEDIFEVKIIKEKMEIKIIKLITPIFVSDVEDLPDDVIIDVEVDGTTENNLELRKEFTIEEIETEDDSIYTFVQKRPEFPGGESALFAFLKSNLVYPRIAREIGLTGIVYVSFIVWKDGAIRAININRGIGMECDDEVLRMMKIMPKWEPGIKDGKKVNVSFEMPISFKLR